MRLPKSLLRYATVGILSNASLYVLFVVMIWVEISAPVSAALCYVLGLTLSYLLNRRWSFESTSTHQRDVPRFLFAYGTGFVATMVFIVLLTRWMRPEIAQVLNVGLTAVVIYICLRLTGFGKAQTARPD